MSHKNPYEFQPQRFPRKPGCYLMRNKSGSVLYVGKAKNLRVRLSQYFQDKPRHPKIPRLVKQISSIEVIITNNEYEALVLENNLIKHHKPRFNAMLMSDKSGYYYLWLTGEEYPRLIRYRKNRYIRALDGLIEVNRGRRLGPYISMTYREVLLDFANDWYGLRNCKQFGNRVCLRYHLRKCSGVCQGHVSKAEYDDRVKQATMLLESRHNDVADEMRKSMQLYAEKLEFEAAIAVRTQLEAIDRALYRQVVERNDEKNQYFIWFEEHHALVAKTAKGILYEMNIVPNSVLSGDTQGLAGAICDIIPVSDLPHEVCIGPVFPPSSVKYIEETLKSTFNVKIKVSCPKQGEKRQVLQLCAINAEYRGADNLDDCKKA